MISQPLPKGQFSHQTKKLFFDCGKGWQSLTIFGPIRYEPVEKDRIQGKDSYAFKDGNVMLTFSDKFTSINGFGRFQYGDHFFAYIYPEIFNTNSENKKALGGTLQIGESGVNSGFGFKNSWSTFQIGKGKENWGAGEDIQLALSEQSESYDYFLLGSDYGRIRVRYIYGFLEKIGNINRYITARGLEYTNERSLIIGLSETVIYSGENRFYEIGYLNPISSHLEIELNNRLNIIGDSNSNAVWQFHLELFPVKNFRFSLNLLYDEFVLDPDIQIGKENGKAFSSRIAFSPSISTKYLLTFYCSMINVGTPTFRHGVGTNNFIQSRIPLGWSRGSDGKELRLGMNFFNYNNLITSVSFGFLEMGDESIINRSYDPFADYQKGKFPSGKVEKFHSFRAEIFYRWRMNYSISTMVQSDKNIYSFYCRLNIPIFQYSQK